MAHQTLDYVSILHAHGYRVTQQRRAILDAICEGEGHTTLGEIYARTRAVDPSIDRSTLYRTLDLFGEVGLVVSAEVAQGERVYEIVKPERHHHLVCSGCGAQVEISHAIVKDLFEALECAHQFAIHSDHLILRGTCADCAGSEPAG